MKKGLILVSLGCVLLVACSVWIWEVRRSADIAAESLPPVTRNMLEVQVALQSAGLAFGFDFLKVGDAWEEPGCDGMGVFLRTENEAVWGWVNSTTRQLTEYVRESEVLAVLEQHVDVEIGALTWDFRQSGPGGRPWYLVGVTQKGGKMVWLRFKTEECGLHRADLEVTKTEGRPGSIKVIELEPHVQPRYSDLYDSVPPVYRGLDQTKAAYEAAQAFTGLRRNYSGDAWIEPECNQVVVYQEGGGKTVWSLFDRTSGVIVDSISTEEVLPALKVQLGDNFAAFYEPWLFRQDAPGERPRYLAGYMTNGWDDVWLHLNSESCSIRPMQLQLAPSTDSIGTFVPLRLPE